MIADNMTTFIGLIAGGLLVAVLLAMLVLLGLVGHVGKLTRRLGRAEAALREARQSAAVARSVPLPIVIAPNTERDDATVTQINPRVPRGGAR